MGDKGMELIATILQCIATRLQTMLHDYKQCYRTANIVIGIGGEVKKGLFYANVPPNPKSMKESLREG